MTTVRKTVELVVQVRCLQCRHKSFLTDRDLIEFGIAENAPIVAFVKRLRCAKCGNSSVVASRVAKTDRGARRTLRA
jgi:cytochrome c-type biogenesis protein CcmH/NrfF